MPVQANIKVHPTWFRRFGAIWTPSVVVLDAGGVERWRVEGYLPKREFHAQLMMALARISAMQKRWPDAEQRYGEVVDHFADTTAAAEALYWRAVSAYRRTTDHGVLTAMAKEMAARHPHSSWALKASVWNGQ